MVFQSAAAPAAPTANDSAHASAAPGMGAGGEASATACAPASVLDALPTLNPDRRQQQQLQPQHQHTARALVPADAHATAPPRKRPRTSTTGWSAAGNGTCGGGIGGRGCCTSVRGLRTRDNVASSSGGGSGRRGGGGGGGNKEEAEGGGGAGDNDTHASSAAHHPFLAAVAAFTARLPQLATYASGGAVKTDWDGWVREQLREPLWATPDAAWRMLVPLCHAARTSDDFLLRSQASSSFSSSSSSSSSSYYHYHPPAANTAAASEAAAHTASAVAAAAPASSSSYSTSFAHDLQRDLIEQIMLDAFSKRSLPPNSTSSAAAASHRRPAPTSLQTQPLNARAPSSSTPSPWPSSPPSFAPQNISSPSPSLSPCPSSSSQIPAHGTSDHPRLPELTAPAVQQPEPTVPPLTSAHVHIVLTNARRQRETSDRARKLTLGLVVQLAFSLHAVAQLPEPFIEDTILPRIKSVYCLCQRGPDEQLSAADDLRTLIAELDARSASSMQPHLHPNPAPGIRSASAYWIRAVSAFCAGLPKLTISIAHPSEPTIPLSSTFSGVAHASELIVEERHRRPLSRNCSCRLTRADVDVWVASIYAGQYASRWAGLADDYSGAINMLAPHLSAFLTETEIRQGVCRLIIRSALHLSATCTCGALIDAHTACLGDCLSEKYVYLTEEEQVILDDNRMTLLRALNTFFALDRLKLYLNFTQYRISPRSSSSSASSAAQEDAAAAALGVDSIDMNEAEALLRTVSLGEACFRTLSREISCSTELLARAMRVDDLFSAEWDRFFRAAVDGYSAAWPCSQENLVRQGLAIGRALRDAQLDAMSKRNLDIPCPRRDVHFGVWSATNPLLHVCSLVGWDPPMAVTLLDATVGIGPRTHAEFKGGRMGYPLYWYRRMKVWDMLQTLCPGVCGCESRNCKRVRCIMSRLRDVFFACPEWSGYDLNEQGLQVLQAAVERGNSAAMQFYGRLLCHDGWDALRQKTKCKMDRMKGIQMILDSAKQGNSGAAITITEMLSYQTPATRLPRHVVKVVMRCLRELRDDDPNAAHELGYLCSYGALGVRVDHEAAVSAFEAAMRHKECTDRIRSSAATNLGVIYETGRGRRRDVAMASKYFALAAICGGSWGRNNLANMLQRGLIRGPQFGNGAGCGGDDGDDDKAKVSNGGRSIINHCESADGVRVRSGTGDVFSGGAACDARLAASRAQYRALFAERAASTPTFITVRDADAGCWTMYQLLVPKEKEDAFVAAVGTPDMCDPSKFGHLQRKWIV